MPDFYDSMYDLGFDDPQDYMDYLESKASNNSSEHDSEETGVIYNEWDSRREEFKSLMDWPRFQELEKNYLQWRKEDVRGKLLENSYIHYQRVLDTLAEVEDYALDPASATKTRLYYYSELLKRLEKWQQWLSLSNDNLTRFKSTIIQSNTSFVDSIIRTRAISNCFDELLMTTCKGSAVLNNFLCINQWIHNNPSYFQQIVISENASFDQLKSNYSESKYLEAIIWKNHYEKIDYDSSLSLFKCLENDENVKWRSCFDKFIEKNECSGKVFSAWKSEHQKEWEDFMKSDSAQQLQTRIKEEESNKTDEDVFLESIDASLAEEGPKEKDKDAPFEEFVFWEDWYYNYYFGKIDRPLFKLWRENNQVKWSIWAEEYLWRNNMGGFYKRYCEKYDSILTKEQHPGYWINYRFLNVFNEWIINHKVQWDDCIKSVDVESEKDAIINTIIVANYILKCKDKNTNDEIANSIGDYLETKLTNWQLIEQIKIQGEKEQALLFYKKQDSLSYNSLRIEWELWIDAVYEKFIDSSFDAIMQEWYSMNSDLELADYYNCCIYMYWFSLLSQKGVLDENFFFENINGFY